MRREEEKRREEEYEREQANRHHGYLPPLTGGEYEHVPTREMVNIPSRRTGRVFAQDVEDTYEEDVDGKIAAETT